MKKIIAILLLLTTYNVNAGNHNNRTEHAKLLNKTSPSYQVNFEYPVFCLQNDKLISYMSKTRLTTLDEKEEFCIKKDLKYIPQKSYWKSLYKKEEMINNKNLVYLQNPAFIDNGLAQHQIDPIHNFLDGKFDNDLKDMVSHFPNYSILTLEALMNFLKKAKGALSFQNRQKEIDEKIEYLGSLIETLRN